MICYEKLQTENQTCPDFELRWCCAKNYLNSTEPNQESFPSYSIDDLPEDSQNIRLIKLNTWQKKIQIILSYIIGDASFIGLDCPSGNVDDCNDGTEESVRNECSGILIVPEKQSRCGSKCSIDQTLTRSEKYQVNATETANFTSTATVTKFWTFYTS